MQQNIFMAVPENNSFSNNDQEQLLSQYTPGRSIQDGDCGSKTIQVGTQNIRGTTSFITNHNPIDIK